MQMSFGRDFYGRDFKYDGNSKQKYPASPGVSKIKTSIPNNNYVHV